MSLQEAHQYLNALRSIVGPAAADMQLMEDEAALVYYYVETRSLEVFIGWRQNAEFTLLVASGGYEESPRIQAAVDFVAAVILKTAFFLPHRTGSFFGPTYTLRFPLTTGGHADFSKYQRNFEPWEQSLEIRDPGA